MRDYKQMQEIQKLKQQAEKEQPGGETKAEDAESKKYEHRAPGFRGWLSYLLEYYKWQILIGLLILVGVIAGISQIHRTSNPDLSLMYIGPYYLTPAEQEKLEASVSALSGEAAGDYNGDGEFRFDFLDLTVAHVTDADGLQYTYDQQNAAYTRFQTELRAGDSLLYFLEPYYYRQAKAEGVLQPLEELGVDVSVSFDGYGIYLGDLDGYELPGFTRMPADTVVCLRRSPEQDAISYGRTVEVWEAHRDLLLQLLSYRSENRADETDAVSDLTLFYAGEQPVFRSIRLPIEQLLSSLTEDSNGDGVCKGTLSAVTRSGSALYGEVAAKEIRTELVAGDSLLWLLDEEAFAYARDHHLLEALPEELAGLEAAVDGYGLTLSSLELYEAEGFSELAGSAVLCLRRNPETETESYGRTVENFRIAEQVFRLLAGYQK